MAGATFSDSWHRVATARVGLLPTVEVRKQRYRSQDWYVLQDTFAQKFFRLTPDAWGFLARLAPAHTVDETWQAYVRDHADIAPGQDEVVQLLSQLNAANLLYFRNQPDSGGLFQRAETRRKRELQGKLMAFLYLRFPLLNPDPWLNRIKPLIHFLLHPLMALVWLAVVTLGGMAALGQRQELVDGAQGLLSLGNLPWLYLSLAGLKLFHELAHAFACKRFGGEVNTLGIMLLILTPLPYMDASGSWSFRSRWQRATVGAAGMIVELFLAAIAALIWANTGDGLLHSVAFNVMVVGSVSSLLFNGNPLLRFDAYYILIDLLDIPNLYQKSGQQWQYFADRYLLGTPDAISPAQDRWEWAWMTTYGVLSYFYRLLISAGIVLFVLDQWFVIGLFMLSVTLFTLVGMPLYKFYLYLHSAKLQRNRSRALLVSAAILTGLVGLIGFLPLPSSIRANGVLEAEKTTPLYSGADGWMSELRVENGARLHQSDVIARLSNPDLEHDLEVTRLQLAEVDMISRQAVRTALAELGPLHERRGALLGRLSELETMQRDLVIVAPQAGRWVAPMLHEARNSWIRRGQVIGEIVAEQGYRCTAVVTQEDAHALFGARLAGVELRLNGQADRVIAVREITLIPYQRQQLASPALGWLGGGDYATAHDDQSGRLAAEPFFELRATVPPEALVGVTVLHGLTGHLRIPLPDRTLFARARESFLQVLQKRYKL
jgi:putative peptide zinc metalloprotease protein